MSTSLETAPCADRMDIDAGTTVRDHRTSESEGSTVPSCRDQEQDQDRPEGPAGRNHQNPHESGRNDGNDHQREREGKEGKDEDDEEKDDGKDENWGISTTAVNVPPMTPLPKPDGNAVDNASMVVGARVGKGDGDVKSLGSGSVIGKEYDVSQFPPPAVVRFTAGLKRPVSCPPLIVKQELSATESPSSPSSLSAKKDDGKQDDDADRTPNFKVGFRDLLACVRERQAAAVEKDADTFADPDVPASSLDAGIWVTKAGRQIMFCLDKESLLTTLRKYRIYEGRNGLNLRSVHRQFNNIGMHTAHRAYTDDQGRVIVAYVLGPQYEKAIDLLTTPLKDLSVLVESIFDSIAHAQLERRRANRSSSGKASDKASAKATNAKGSKNKRKKKGDAIVDEEEGNSPRPSAAKAGKTGKVSSKKGGNSATTGKATAKSARGRKAGAKATGADHRATASDKTDSQGAPKKKRGRKSGSKKGADASAQQQHIAPSSPHTQSQQYSHMAGSQMKMQMLQQPQQHYRFTSSQVYDDADERSAPPSSPVILSSPLRSNSGSQGDLMMMRNSALPPTSPEYPEHVRAASMSGASVGHYSGRPSVDESASYSEIGNFAGSRGDEFDDDGDDDDDRSGDDTQGTDDDSDDGSIDGVAFDSQVRPRFSPSLKRPRPNGDPNHDIAPEVETSACVLLSMAMGFQSIHDPDRDAHLQSPSKRSRSVPLPLITPAPPSPAYPACPAPPMMMMGVPGVTKTGSIRAVRGVNDFGRSPPPYFDPQQVQQYPPAYSLDAKKPRMQIQGQPRAPIPMVPRKME